MIETIKSMSMKQWLEDLITLLMVGISLSIMLLPVILLIKIFSGGS